MELSGIVIVILTLFQADFNVMPELNNVRDVVTGNNLTGLISTVSIFALNPPLTLITSLDLYAQ